MVQDHWLLMLAIAGLYLYDSASMLFHNEVVLDARGRGYVVSAGSSMELHGKHLFLPNPLCPHRALARLSWPGGEIPQWRPAQWKRSRLALSIIAPWTWLLLLMFFIALPLTLRFGTPLMLLQWLILTYLSIIAMLGIVYRYRAALGLTPRAVLALALDALLCAPFAINMVRKISQKQASSASLLGFASAILSVDERAVLSRVLDQRIQISLDHVDPDSEASTALLAYLRQYNVSQS